MNKVNSMADRSSVDEYDSEHMLRARSQFLEVSARICRWNGGSARERQVCRIYLVESVYHMIVECVGYEMERCLLLA